MKNIDFQKASLEEINSITQDDLKGLPEEEFFKYHRRSQELGNIFAFNGVPVGDPDHTRYGTGIKSITKDYEGKWVVMSGMGLIPKYELFPIMVNEEVFSEKMKSLGVSEELLKDFFSMKEEIPDIF